MRKLIDLIEKAELSITDTPAFKAWFVGSKVVDSNGLPLRVYHGGSPNIDKFDKNKIGQNFGDSHGFYFTTNTSYDTAWYGGNDYRVYDDMYSAGAYAKNVQGAVYPCYLRIVNPLYLRDWAEIVGLDFDHEISDYGHPQDILDIHKKSIMNYANSHGHDGIIAIHGNDAVYVVFEPKQIKSAFAKNFDHDSEYISENSEVTYTLFHGTCSDELVKNGWKPNQRTSGANMGQSKYLYLTSDPEDARWFANNKGCDTIIVVKNIPVSYLKVDPEDGFADTVEAEINNDFGIPGKVVLIKPLDSAHFELFND